MTVSDMAKVELHLHHEGAAPPAFIRGLAAEKKVDLSGIFNERGGYHYKDSWGFLKVYEAATSVLESLFEQTAADTLSPERVHMGLQEAGMLARDDGPGNRGVEVRIKARTGLIRGRGHNQQHYLRAIRDCAGFSSRRHVPEGGSLFAPHVRRPVRNAGVRPGGASHGNERHRNRAPGLYAWAEPQRFLRDSRRGAEYE